MSTNFNEQLYTFSIDSSSITMSTIHTRYQLGIIINASGHCKQIRIVVYSQNRVCSHANLTTIHESNNNNSMPDGGNMA